MDQVKKMTDRILAIREARDWKQFHTPKDCVISLVLEATEVMEHFQYKDEKEIDEYIKNHREEIGDELADTLYWVFLMSHDFGIDIVEAFDRKMSEIEKKYPVEKSKGKHTKYNQLT